MTPTNKNKKIEEILEDILYEAIIDQQVKPHRILNSPDLVKALYRLMLQERLDELKNLPLDVHAHHGSHANMCIPIVARNSRVRKLKEQLDGGK